MKIIKKENSGSNSLLTRLKSSKPLSEEIQEGFVDGVLGRHYGALNTLREDAFEIFGWAFAKVITPPTLMLIPMVPLIKDHHELIVSCIMGITTLASSTWALASYIKLRRNRVRFKAEIEDATEQLYNLMMDGKLTAELAQRNAAQFFEYTSLAGISVSDKACDLIQSGKLTDRYSEEKLVWLLDTKDLLDALQSGYIKSSYALQRAAECLTLRTGNEAAVPLLEEGKKED